MDSPTSPGMTRSGRGYSLSRYEWELLEERGFVAGISIRGWYEHFLATDDADYLERLLVLFSPPADDVRLVATYAQGDFLNGKVALATDTRLLSYIATLPENLLSLSWRDFELFTAEMLQKLGYSDVRVGAGYSGGGIDVSAFLEGAAKLLSIPIGRQETGTCTTQSGCQKAIG
jgi:hypothetical protein